MEYTWIYPSYLYPIGSMVLLYMVTFTINKPAPWILWVWGWVKTYELPLWEEWHPAQLLGLLGFHRGFSQVCAPLRPLASRWVRKPESGRNHGIWWKKLSRAVIAAVFTTKKNWSVNGKWWFYSWKMVIYRWKMVIYRWNMVFFFHSFCVCLPKVKH